MKDRSFQAMQARAKAAARRYYQEEMTEIYKKLQTETDPEKIKKYEAHLRFINDRLDNLW
ncbi:MAG: hypothetical protein IJU03_10315 [Thermoguttaceae bacterium]|nr:hypothetical protein [Thermoguttaceae bacterium]